MSLSFRSLRARGFTLMELLVSAAITGLLVAGLALVVSPALQSQTVATERNRQLQEARFAMERMVNAVKGTRLLLLPLADNPATPWREHVREQYLPAQPPESGSVLATAVLAVSLSPAIDSDGDGWADANDDKDFLDLNGNLLRDAGEPERIDEDISSDATKDGEPGIKGIDDNGDGYVDDTMAAQTPFDDDEDDAVDEDPVDGLDNDGDGLVDEDSGKDMNDDGQAGVAGVDDDLDLFTDEGAFSDDDEDGQSEEDFINAVVYYLSGDQLLERLPAFSDINGDGAITGKDYTEAAIAGGISGLRIERLPLAGGSAQLVDITLTLSGREPLTLTARVRVGGGL